MCGVFAWNNANKEQFELIDSFYEALSHRGPDAHGINISLDGVLIGSTRLAINDLSSAGDQPLVDEDSKVSLVMNGEIYNFRELRQELLTLGIKFFSSTDTEVALRGYLHWGMDVFQRLQGMFAILISDPRNETIVAARDRLGEKPLFYFAEKNQIAFSSEYRILAKEFLEPNKRILTLDSRVEFLRYGFLTNSLPFGGSIKKVQQGSYMVFTKEKVYQQFYWKAREEFQPKRKNRAKQSHRVLSQIIKDSVKSEIECSDVPVGVLLSGGIDSRVIATAASEVNRDLVFFTAAFRNENYDESWQATKIAKELGVRHEIHYIDFDMEDVIKIVKKLDLPLADTSMIPTYLISRHARKFVKVCLTGDGGDEFFGGYSTYRATQLSKIFIRIRPLLLFLKWVALRIKSDDSNIGWRYKVKAFVRVISPDIYVNHRNWRMVFADWEIAQLLSVEEPTLPMVSRKFESRADLSVIENCMLMDIEEWLESDVLQKTDQGSMMNSLEFRAPLLHPEVIGYALKLPLSRKINFFQQKVILRNILGQQSISNIWPKKKGFGAPVSEWIMTHPSKFRTQLALNSNFNQAFVDDLFDRHIAREEDNSFKIYTLLVITLWEKEASEVLV